MQKAYSTNDLILYLYNETGMEDSVFIQQDIDHDEETSEEFSQLVAVHELLDKVTFNQRQSTIDTLTAYSKMHSFLH